MSRLYKRQSECKYCKLTIFFFHRMGVNSSRRMSQSPMDLRSDSESDDDDYRLILQTFIDRLWGYVPAPSRKKYSEKEKESTTNTSVLDASEFSMYTKKAAGLSPADKKCFIKYNNVCSSILNREKGIYKTGGFSCERKCRITNNYLPNYLENQDRYDSKVFCGIFSNDGERFLSASQDHIIRMFDSSTGSYKLLNSFRARDVGWSIIDVAFSSDRKNFVYSTWSSALHLCPVTNDKDSEQEEHLCVLNKARRFCIFSVVFGSNDKELLGGANDGCLYIYDLIRNDCTLKIPAHEYDVNSVVFADESSHIIYSGGDDGVIRVWDRRCLNETNPKPVGILAGHMDGITFIDSRGDGRHLISNSKDQSIKLWDVRIFSGEKAAALSLRAVDRANWDYRWQEVPTQAFGSHKRLEGDTSIMTYEGHTVTKTLIRCRFSPVATTGQRYIYTGCGKGRIVIYDSLTGKQAQIINGHTMCVRDVSWHPRRNEIISSSWDCKVCRWNYRDNDSYLGDITEMVASETYNNKSPKSFRRSLRLALKKKRQQQN